MSASLRRIGTLGLSASEARVLELLTLQSRQRGATWEWADDNDADVLVIDPLVPFTHPVVQRALDTGSPLLVGYRRGSNASRVNVLHINAPGSLDGLMHVMAEAESRMTSRRAPEVQDGRRIGRAPVEAPPPRRDDLEREPPGRVEAPALPPAGAVPNERAAATSASAEARLRAKDAAPTRGSDRLARLAALERLRELAEQPLGAFAIAFNGDERVVVLLPERVVVARRGLEITPEALTNLIARAGGEIEVRELDDDEAVDPVWDNTRHPLDVLLWCAANALAGSDMLPELPERGTFRLLRWPDFGSVGSSTAGFRIAAQLTRVALDLDALTALVNRQRGVAIAFLNACAVCGYLVAQPPLQAPVEFHKSAAAGVGRLLSRLRNALGLAPG